MSYIAALIALFKTPDNLNGAPWWDAFLDQLVAVETFFFHLSWWIWGIGLAIGLLFALYVGLRFGREALTGLSCYVGCFGIVLLLWPLWEYITMRLAMSMAASVDPTGVINNGKLIISAILFFLLGTG